LASLWGPRPSDSRPFDRSPLFCLDFEKLQHVQHLQVVSDKRLRDQQRQKFRRCNSAKTKTLEFGADLKKIKKSSFSSSVQFCLAFQEDFKVTKAKGGDPKLGTIAGGPPRHHGAGVYRRMGPYAGKFQDLLWGFFTFEKYVCTYLQILVHDTNLHFMVL